MPISASFLLSPPDSLSGPLSTATATTSAGNHYLTSNLPSFFAGNVSSSEPYTNVPASCHSQMLFEPSMSDFNNRPRAPAPYNNYPASSSPPMTFSSNPPTSFPVFQRGLPEPNPYTSYRAGPNSVFTNGHSKYSSLPPQLGGNGEYFPQSMPSDRQNSPPFEETKVLKTVVSQSNHHIIPEIEANIPKGFFEVEGKWTCYRRNYFPVSCSFSTKPQVPNGVYYLQRDAQQPIPISQFAVSISAKTAIMNNQDSQTRGLVQHTPKRDKATESTPGKVVIQPTSQMSPNLIPLSMHSYMSPQHVSPNMIQNYEPFPGGQQQSTPTQYTFERIQFQKATANNGKRRAQQQFFHVVVELWADVGKLGKPDWVEIATKQSAQMVVRGRSPGHYKDNVRRDSTTSMDPDRGTGAGGDSGGVVHGQTSMLPHNNGMEWGPTGSTDHHSYGNGSYRRPGGTSSPDSDSSSGTLTESPIGLDASLKVDTAIGSLEETDRKFCRTNLQNDSVFTYGTVGISSSLKRPYEEDLTFLPSNLESGRSLHIEPYLPSHLAYAPSQSLRVS